MLQTSNLIFWSYHSFTDTTNYLSPVESMVKTSPDAIQIVKLLKLIHINDVHNKGGTTYVTILLPRSFVLKVPQLPKIPLSAPHAKHNKNSYTSKIGTSNICTQRRARTLVTILLQFLQ